MDINLKLRSEILEYSLNIEKAINDLILLNLGILDEGNSTRLFGSKAGITFKNKIDLLYDIDVLSKEENSDLELLMVFRNKFLHVIECNSFSSVLEQLDNGLKNKFKSYLKEGEDLNNEESCRNACSNLFLKNIKTIRRKVTSHKNKMNERNELFQLNNQQTINYIDIFFDLIDDIYSILENSDLDNEEIRQLSEAISGKCLLYLNKSQSEEFISLTNKLNLFFSDIGNVKNYFDIKRVRNNLNFNSILDELKK